MKPSIRTTVKQRAEYLERNLIVKRMTKQFRLLGIITMCGMILTSSVGCVSGRTYKDIVETSVKTVAATLLDLIIIDNLEARANGN